MVLASNIEAAQNQNNEQLMQANHEKVREIAGLKHNLENHLLYQTFDKLQTAGLEIVSHQLDDAEMESVEIDDIYLLDIAGEGSLKGMKPSRSLLVSHHSKKEPSFINKSHILYLPGENSGTDKFADLLYGVRSNETKGCFVDVPIFEDDGKVKEAKSVSIIEIAPTVNDFPAFSGQLPLNDGGELKVVVQRVIHMSLMNKINRFEAIIQSAMENQRGDLSDSLKAEWEQIEADLDKASEFHSDPGKGVENKILDALAMADKLFDPERDLHTTPQGPGDFGGGGSDSGKSPIGPTEAQDLDGQDLAAAGYES